MGFSFIQVGPQFGHGPRHVLEDAYDGCYQLAHNPLLALAFSGTIISIAYFALQLLGFCILIVGMMLYNDIVILPIGRRVFATCSQQEPYGVMEEEEEGDQEERVSVRG